MSARALQALRKKQGGDLSLLPVVPDESSEEEDDDDDSDDNHNMGKNTRGFAGMMDDEDSSSEEEEEESNGDEGGDEGENDGKMVSPSDETDVTENNIESVARAKVGGATTKVEAAEALEVVSEAEPDLDEMLAEFQEKDGELAELETPDGESKKGPSVFNIILADMDPRDLDYEFSMRTSLLGGGSSNSVPLSASRQRKNRQTLLFGTARDGWNRPPHYVGGGIGMTTYDRDPRLIPWPYQSGLNDPGQEGQPGNQEGAMNTNALEVDDKQCFRFMHSDSYKQDCEDYRYIQQSGDMNSLVMFVAHHPYVTEALLQLTLVLYQTQHSAEGLALLRRCLWIYECSSLLNFTRELEGSAFMDFDLSENATYFRALFRLVQVSNIAGLPKTSLAVSRYILALDPLRDPMGVLLAIDHYALACNSSHLDQWLVNLVESDVIHIRYRDIRTFKTYYCGLLDLPNWAFSYALALFRLQSENPSEDGKAKANAAIQAAISKYPNMVGLLLQDNEVDTTGRSFRRDWISVLDFASDRSKQLRNKWWSSDAVDTIILTATLQACDLVIKITVQQNAKIWGNDEVLQWLFDNLKEVQATKPELPTFPSPAMLRYASCDPLDYEKKIQLLPPDMNVIDPSLLVHAMEVNTNRPRLVRRMPRGGGGGAGGGGGGGAAMQMQEHHDANGVPATANQQRLMGPPTQVVDPDWPMAEVFWRSFLPWNRVEGMPPARR